MRYISLTEEEKQQLTELQKTSGNSVVRERSLCLLLSDKRYNVKEIASLTNLCRQTISTLLTTWESALAQNKLSTLSIASGRGAKVKLEPVAEFLPDLVEKHSRNLKPILDALEKEHSIKVSKATLQGFLKGAGL